MLQPCSIASLRRRRQWQKIGIRSHPYRRLTPSVPLKDPREDWGPEKDENAHHEPKSVGAQQVQVLQVRGALPQSGVWAGVDCLRVKLILFQAHQIVYRTSFVDDWLVLNILCSHGKATGCPMGQYGLGEEKRRRLT